jgi:hypothetical protein
MTPKLLSVLFVLLCLPLAWAEDSPRELLVRAVQAQGGEAKLLEGPALYRRIHGRYFTGAGALVGEAFHQYPGLYKDVVRLLDQPSEQPFVYLLTPEKGYIGPRGSGEEITGEALAELRLGSYKDHLRDLLIGLLHDKTAEFTARPETVVHHKPALGLHYESKQYGAMDLYFDKASHFLVKMAYADHSQGLRVGKARERQVAILIDRYRTPDYEKTSAQMLKAAGRATDDRALVSLLRQQVIDEKSRKHLQALIEDLGDDEFDRREKATAELIRIGLPALPYVQKASKDSDPEVKRRALRCLKEIDSPGKREALRDALLADLQLLALRKPKDAAEALLAYLPQVTSDEWLKVEVLNALEAVAVRQGRPDPAVTAALNSSDRLQRQTALGLLGRDGGVLARRTCRRVWVEGVKIPTQFTWLIDDEKNTSWEIPEFRFYNAFDKSVFKEP